MPMTSDQYPQEYLQLMLAACEEQRVIRTTYSQAVKARQTLHSLRAALKREGDPVYHQIKMVMVQLRPAKSENSEVPCTMIIKQRANDDFVDLIKETIGEADAPVDITEFINPETMPDLAPVDTSPNKIVPTPDPLESDEEQDYMQVLMEDEDDSDLDDKA